MSGTGKMRIVGRKAVEVDSDTICTLLEEHIARAYPNMDFEKLRFFGRPSRRSGRLAELEGFKVVAPLREEDD